MNQNFRILSLVAVFLVGASASSGKATEQEKNKEVVKSFYSLAFNEHRPEEAVKLYVGSTYTQHNPFVSDGKQAFIDFFKPFQAKHPQSHATIKRIIAENDLVVVHVHSTTEPTDRGRAVMDIFRLSDGKIVEHWDVAQPIPERAENKNTMF